MLGSTTLTFACCKNAQTQISSCLHIPTTTMPVPMSKFGPRIVTCHVVVPEHATEDADEYDKEDDDPCDDDDCDDERATAMRHPENCVWELRRDQ